MRRRRRIHQPYDIWCWLTATRQDVFVATPPKCGTTWMQQICYQLATGGDMSFECISAVSPWLEVALDVQQPLSDEFPAEQPRIIKSHLVCSRIPMSEQAKYDCVSTLLHCNEPRIND